VKLKNADLSEKYTEKLLGHLELPYFFMKKFSFCLCYPALGFARGAILLGLFNKDFSRSMNKKGVRLLSEDFSSAHFGFCSMPSCTSKRKAVEASIDFDGFKALVTIPLEGSGHALVPKVTIS